MFVIIFRMFGHTLYQARKKQLIQYFRTHGHLPTYDELVRLFRLQSKGSLHKYVKKFIEDGLLRKNSTGKLLATKKLYGLQVFGTVAAGFPSPAEEELADSMSLDEYLIEKPDSTFLLTVSGDSMIDAGIMPGDMVLVERGRAPKSGDIVIAEVDHEWTIKYFVKQGGGAVLRAANKAYHDIKPTQELKIAGVVRSMVRKY